MCLAMRTESSFMTPDPRRAVFLPPSRPNCKFNDLVNRSENQDSLFNTGECLPATPPDIGGSFRSLHPQEPSINLSNNAKPQEVDEILPTMFQKVELVGTGEFSNVYRVTRKYSSDSSQARCFGDQVFAVKKLRQPFKGIKDRQRRLQEVNVLRRLRHSENILRFIDSWEHGGYIYIQTEFCEEGSLDVFLAQVGMKGRLDSFRVWKILLEITNVSLSVCLLFYLME